MHPSPLVTGTTLPCPKPGHEIDVVVLVGAVRPHHFTRLHTSDGHDAETLGAPDKTWRIQP